jgi:hypothetical protein
MKIFISWSGEDSLQIAKALRDWIPNVIQIAEPYVSAEDIDKGVRWATDVSKELDDSSYGIICLTKNNIAAPWINFEAGSLGKKVEKSRVSPFLFKIKPSEITGPILQFQHTSSDDKDDVFKLIKSINTQAKFLTEDRLLLSFEQWWPDLQKKMAEIPDLDVDGKEPSKTSKQSQNTEIQNLSKIIESLLDISRTNHQLLRNPESILPEDYLDKIINRNKRRETTLRQVTADLVDVQDAINRLRRNLLMGMINLQNETKIIELINSILESFEKPLNYMQLKYGETKDVSANLPTLLARRRTSKNLLDKFKLDEPEQNDSEKE